MSELFARLWSWLRVALVLGGFVLLAVVLANATGAR